MSEDSKEMWPDQKCTHESLNGSGRTGLGRGAGMWFESGCAGLMPISGQINYLYGVGGG